MTVYRITDLIQQLEKAREKHGDLILQRPSLKAADADLNLLINIEPSHIETLNNEEAEQQ